MNPNYIARALCYHGHPMQKILEDEHSVKDVREMGLPAQPNYSIYQERQKFFTFQERAKRLKMHQFLARKAPELYDKFLVANVMEDALLEKAKICTAAMPPYDYFLNAKDKAKAWHYRMSKLSPGVIVCASVQRTVGTNRILVKPLCTAEPLHCYLSDIPIKANIFLNNYNGMPLDKQGNPRSFSTNELLLCEITEVSADAQRLTLSLTTTNNKTPGTKLGLCDLSAFPKYYRKIHGLDNVQSYEEQLLNLPEFENPNIDVLFQMNGLQPNESLTMMTHLKDGFPDQECAPELRQKQASQWAFRSVADGIEHFKNGLQVEAFQCLNKALNIDPRNVEGLVARGALYANRGSFLKAIADFEKALLLNKYHVNARKYMGETLVALGRSYEDENRIPEAMKSYSDCLCLIPQHEQARQSLEALQRPQGPMYPQIYGNLMNLQATNVAASTPASAPTKQIVISSEDDDTSTSDSDNDSEERSNAEKSGNAAKLKFNQPFFAMQQAVSDAKKVDEFKLDDDDTMNSVRKLLRDASKHKKAKKKNKKKDKKGKQEKKKESDLDTVEMLKKIDFSEAYRLMTSAENEAQLKESLQSYLQQNEKPMAVPEREQSESPPPAPSARKKPINDAYDSLDGPSTSKYAKAISGVRMTYDNEQPPPPPKLSFQIKKLDKFGMLRLATPLNRHSPSRSRSPPLRGQQKRELSSTRRKSRSFSPRYRSRRSRSYSRNRYSRSNSRSRSRSSRFRRWDRSRDRSKRRGNSRFGRRSPSRTSSRSFNRRRSPSPFQQHRRTPSPFDPNRSPSPSSRFARRSRSSSRSSRRSPRRSPRRNSQRSPHGRQNQRSGRGSQSNQYRWVRKNEASHERNGNENRKIAAKETAAGKADDPTIEEIDEMIKEAQNKRKQGIIQGDKDILKKTA